MRYCDLFEAPIDDMAFKGDLDTPGTFRQSDLKKLNDPSWRDRVQKIFQKCPFDIGLYFLNGPEMGKIRFDTPHFRNVVNTSQARDYVGLHAPAWANVVLGGLPQGYENRVNVILTQNEGSDRVGLTPWIVAHRIGHCFLETNNRDVMRQMNGQATAASNMMQSTVNRLESVLKAHGGSDEGSDSDRMNRIAKRISPFRTARTGRIRDTGEYVVELMAQYLTSGRVTFNRMNLDGPITRRKLEGEEYELFRVAKSQLSGYAFDRHPIREDWLQEELREIFRRMKSLPGSPKSAIGVRKLYMKWVEEGQFRPPENDTARVDEILTEAEETVNAVFHRMLEMAKGQFVVL